ncbi:MAG TPA: alginate export family protein [Thermoanaerobaculia bacterium]|nr:alginate export family protein [Thermoanaerobaculia bacterium]
MRKCFWLAALLAALGTGPVLATPPTVKPTFDLRLRHEEWDAPARNAVTESSYDFDLLRARLGLDLAWEHWTLHGMIQAAGAFDLPENGSFGAGPNYVAANRGDTGFGVLALAELSALYQRQGLRLVLGRQPYADGFEIPTGVASLDRIKRARLGDRLVGVFEWTNVGRRFDGASAGYGEGGGHVAVFALRPLTGAFDHRDAFEPIDDVTVFGGAFTGKYGVWIPGAEFRAFAIQYEDDRRVAPVGGLSLTTAGGSLLWGNPRGNVLAWAAVQRGDWGLADQEAWAVAVDLGRELDGAPGKPSVHLAFEEASGDGRPGGTHESFFNLLPTNHKYYDLIDFTAFSNLRDVYLETWLSAGPKVKVRAAAHDLSLLETRDAWYGGSGAFQEGSFGYTPRLPARGVFSSKNLGRELGTDVAWTIRDGLQLTVGGAYFWGGDAAAAFLPVKEDAGWGYVELSWKR